MNKDYLTSTHTKAKKLSVRKNLLSIALLFFISFAFAQQTATITTTQDGVFALDIDNTGHASLTIEVTGAVNLGPFTNVADAPVLDLTGSGGGLSTITITSPNNFIYLKKLEAANTYVETIDISNLTELEELRISNNGPHVIGGVLVGNGLSNLHLSSNDKLWFLNAKNNVISTIDFSNNSALRYLDLEGQGGNMSSIDVSNLINLEHFDIEYNDLTTINIDNNSKLTNFQIGYNKITNDVIDYILNTLDSFGLSNGILEVSPSSTGEGAYVTKDGIDAFRRLDKRYSGSKNWTIDLDPSIDYGDAPDSYQTLSPNGASHLRVYKQEFWLGLIRDTENNGFPGGNADGDDTDNVDDEDGVATTEFDNISETTTTVDIDVQVLNNTTHNGELHAWIDFDRNGTFDADEYVSVTVAPTPSPVPASLKGALRKAALKRAITTFTVTWNNIGTTGPDIVPGPTYARFRFTSDVISANDPGGIVNAGEVEDYGFEILTDFDKDGIPDVSDLDADNDGILNVDEGYNAGDPANSVDTDGDGMPDYLDLDADGDGCLDAKEAGQIDGDGDGIVGTGAVAVDSDGLVISDTKGAIPHGGLPDGTGAYTVPPALDRNSNGIWDFQEAGVAPSITTQPVNQDFVSGGSATFTADVVGDTLQWEVSTDGGTTWANVVDDANNSGATTNSLMVSNLTDPDSNNLYRLNVQYLSFACDPGPVISDIVGFNLILDALVTNVNCFGEANGAIDITVNGGVLPYTYAWTTADGSGLVPGDEDQTGLTVGTYEVTVTDANSTSITQSFTLTQPDEIVVTGVVTDTSVNGGNDGTIDITVAGGVSPYKYEWTTADGSGLVPGAEDQTSLTSGTYTVKVTDDNGCEMTKSFTVNEPNSLVIDLVNINNVTCNGASDGAIDISVSGGVTPYTYAWSISGVVIANTEDLTGVPGGTYTITVTDANGATRSATYEVKEEPAILISGVVTHVSTVGGSDGAIDITVQGGTGTYSYLWSNGATTEDISGLSAGDYTVAVKDGAGCTITAAFTVSDPGSGGIIITGNVTDVKCFNGTDGTIDITVTGGTAPYTFVWSNGETTEDISGLTAGDYTVKVRDALGVEASHSFSIDQPTRVELNANITNVSVPGGNDGAIDLTVHGGTAPYTYSWNTGQVSEDISGLTAGIYTVVVVDANGCSATAAYTVSQPGGNISIILNALTHVTCSGDKNGAIDISVAGGTAPYTYSWSLDGTEISKNEDLTGLSGGVYTVTVTDANNNTAARSFLVNESDPLAAIANVTDVSINGGNDGAIDLIVTGGTAPFLYAWSNGAVTEDISNLKAGTYTVTVTDKNGCSVEGSFTVNEPGAMDLTVEITNVSCNGLSDGAIDLTVIGGVAPFSYIWTTADGSGLVPGDEDQADLTAGTYNVTVTDVNGASVNGSYEVTEPDVIVISEVTSTDPTCPSLDDGTITVTATGTDLEYSIDNGTTFQDSNEFTGLIGGTYNVVVRVKTSPTCSESYGTEIVLDKPLCAELAVVKTQTGGVNPVTDIGQTLDYTITLENTGLADITGVNIADILPDGTDGVLNGPTGDSGTQGVIEIGETWTYTISYTSQLSDFVSPFEAVNTVIVTVNEIEETMTATAVTPVSQIDTDKDGILDVYDVDDDNDGILDTVEENGDPNRDTDGDGVLDRLDWDADGDQCPDVTEAGFTNNGNDMLGNQNPPVVDLEGKVVSASDGYTTPNDLNNNGIPDFQEAGLPSAITSHPSDIEVTLGDNAVFSVSGNATYYQWQVSTDDGSSWSDLMDDAQYDGTQTNTLTVHEARGRVESNLYRVILRTPDYACDPNPELISEAGKLMFNQLRIPNGFSPNGDGENDLFSIPGLDQYPNFKMKIFDRWGNMVYHYENNGSGSPQWWDGHAKGSMVLSDGQRVPAGTYYYMIDYNDGGTKPIKGWVYVNY